MKSMASLEKSRLRIFVATLVRRSLSVLPEGVKLSNPALTLAAFRIATAVNKASLVGKRA